MGEIQTFHHQYGARWSLTAAQQAGGRTSVEREASVWLPLLCQFQD